MHAFCLGVSAAAGIMALIPSKLEYEKEVPWCSILLALISGINLWVGLSY